MATPPPLPPVREDPAIQAGYTLQAAYPQALADARVKANMTSIDRARLINRIWRQTITDLTAARTDLHTRRTARRAWLETQLPLGPGIPAGTTPADHAVLITAWNNALAAARAATPKQRAAMLTDAARFGDTATLRATLTVCVDNSEWHAVDGWGKAADPDTLALFNEWRQSISQLADGGTGVLFEAQAFQLPAQPPESVQLPRLVDEYNAAAYAFNSTKARTEPARALLELDPGETTPAPYPATA
jgi:hypothetical protein